MTINYSIVEDSVRETITVPESEQVRDLGEKDTAVAALTAEIAKHQGSIDSYTGLIAEVQAKLDAINAL